MFNFCLLSTPIAATPKWLPLALLHSRRTASLHFVQTSYVTLLSEAFGHFLPPFRPKPFSALHP